MWFNWNMERLDLTRCFRFWAMPNFKNRITEMSKYVNIYMQYVVIQTEIVKWTKKKRKKMKWNEIERSPDCIGNNQIEIIAWGKPKNVNEKVEHMLDKIFKRLEWKGTIQHSAQYSTVKCRPARHEMRYSIFNYCPFHKWEKPFQFNGQM